MFNKKMVSMFLHVVAVLLLLKELWLVVMFVWSIFGRPVDPIFDVQNNWLPSVFVFIQETGGVLFQYAFVAVLAYATAKLATNSAAPKPAHRTTKK